MGQLPIVYTILNCCLLVPVKVPPIVQVITLRNVPPVSAIQGAIRKPAIPPHRAVTLMGNLGSANNWLCSADTA